MTDANSPGHGGEHDLFDDQKENTVGLGSLLCGLFLLALGIRVFAGWTIDHGSLITFKESYANFLFVFSVLGIASIVLLTSGFPRALLRRLDGLLRALSDVSLARWLFWASLSGLLLAVLYRSLVLHDMPFSDDEAVYRFASQLLLSGSLSVQSHPLKVFFDQSFMVNDGQYYPQYFMGWPALLAPFVVLGLEGFANAFYYAAFLAVLGLILARLLGPNWAKVGTALALTSPFLLFLAASGLSHMSCLLALGGVAYASLRLVDAGDDTKSMLRWAVVLAVAFSSAFFIRPQSAIPVGGALVLWCFWRSFRQRSRAWLRAVVVFALVSLPFGAAFLGINQVQNGSPFKTSYQRTAEYAAENLYRFTHFRPTSTGLNMRFESIDEAARKWTVAIARFNFVALGWPFAFLFLILALRAPGARPFVVAFVAIFVLYIFGSDPGIDTLGPVHYAEAMLPFLVLTTLGLERTSRWLSNVPGEQRVSRLPALVVVCVLVNLAFYLPTRARAQSLLATAVAAPLEAAQTLEQAVVFATWPLNRGCIPGESRPLVYWWPLNDPDMHNDVLWANHVGLADDRRLMREHFPERTGYILAYTQNCTPAFVLLDDPPDESLLPPGLPGGLAGQPDAKQQGFIP